jgi:DNA-binding HxlR family transcriptional regulator
MPRQEQRHEQQHHHERHSEGARLPRPEARKRADKPAQPVHDFDRLIHERMRLGILSALAVNESLSFNDLKSLLSTTDGNLSVHARKLEEAGYVACNKYFEGRVPRTEYRLTRIGRQALEQYLNDMESLIETMRKR